MGIEKGGLFSGIAKSATAASVVFSLTETEKETGNFHTPVAVPGIVATGKHHVFAAENGTGIGDLISFNKGTANSIQIIVGNGNGADIGEEIFGGSNCDSTVKLVGELVSVSGMDHKYTNLENLNKDSPKISEAAPGSDISVFCDNLNVVNSGNGKAGSGKDHSVLSKLVLDKAVEIANETGNGHVEIDSTVTKAAESGENVNVSVGMETAGNAENGTENTMSVALRNHALKEVTADLDTSKLTVSRHLTTAKPQRKTSRTAAKQAATKMKQFK